MVRLGRLISDAQIAKIRAAEETLSARVQSIFDDVDVLITPGTASGPSRIGQYQHRGGVTGLALAASRVPFNAIFNATGQPAAVVPWGLDSQGVPVSVNSSAGLPTRPRCYRSATRSRPRGRGPVAGRRCHDPAMTRHAASLSA